VTERERVCGRKRKVCELLRNNTNFKILLAHIIKELVTNFVKVHLRVRLQRLISHLAIAFLRTE